MSFLQLFQIEACLESVNLMTPVIKQTQVRQTPDMWPDEGASSERSGNTNDSM